MDFHREEPGRDALAKDTLRQKPVDHPREEREEVDGKSHEDELAGY